MSGLKDNLAALVVIGCGIVTFVMPLNKCIKRLFQFVNSSKVLADDTDDEEKTIWNRLHNVWLAAVAEKIPSSLRRFAGAVCIYIGTRALKLDLAGPKDNATIRVALNTTAMVILLLFGVLLLLAYVDAFGQYFASRSKKTKTYLDDQITSFLVNGTKTALIVVAGACVLQNFGIDVSAIYASIGVSTLAIALALQDYVKNIVGLFILLTDQPLELNDHVKVAGIEGFVVSIKFRFTTIKDFAGVRHVIPNSTFISSTVANWYKQEQTKIQLEWVVTYATPSKTIQELRENILTYLKGGTEPMVGSWVDVNVSFATDGVHFKLSFFYKGGEGLVRTTDPGWNFYHEARALKARVLVFIMDELAARKIEIAESHILAMKQG